MYFKIVDLAGHRGMIYKEGINEDILPFNPSGHCQSGGIYFSKEDILAFADYGTDVYSVEPIGEVYENPGKPKKWKAHSVNLTYVGKLWDVKTFKFLLEHGVNVHAQNDYALRYASRNGHFEIVKFLVENGANIHAGENEALRFAAYYRHLEIVKFLVQNGADIHALDDEALRYAAARGYFEVVKFLVENGANIHAENDFALRYASNQNIKDYLQSIIDKK